MSKIYADSRAIAKWTKEFGDAMKRQSTTRRHFLRSAGLGAAALTCRLQAATAAAEKFAKKHKRPNLIYMFADQLGYSRCGYAGEKRARTPNIDKLAADGVNFFNAISNMPVCAAYRASLFTGKYTTTTGMVINELRMNTNHECLGHVLTRAGYQTGYIGKWHLYANRLGGHTNPRNSYTPPGKHRLGFDGYWAAYGFHHGYYNAYYHTNSPEKVPYPKGAYEPDAQTDMAIDYINKASKADPPFALVLSVGTPHDPWSPRNVPDKYYEMFKDVKFPPAENYSDKLDPHGDGWSNMKKSPQRIEQWMRVYFAMTANLDWNVGRLLEAIDKAGIADNTIFVFSSDHGEMFGAHGRMKKNIFYEEAARVPFLVRWPRKIPAGLRCDATLGTVDIMPTLLGLMGLKVPAKAEGMDLSRRAMGLKGPQPQAAFLQNTGACAIWANGHEWRAVRDKRYTYAVYRADKSELLFDNTADPYQQKNLAGDPAHKKTVERFRKMLADKMKSLNDTFAESTWYRDNWIKNRIILRGARG